MVFKPPFPEAAITYIDKHKDEMSRPMLAYKVRCLFGYDCNKEGVKGVIRRLKKQKEVMDCETLQAKATA